MKLTAQTKIRLNQIVDLLTWRTVKDWDESEHPRGNPENKGQFKSKKSKSGKNGNKRKTKRTRGRIPSFIITKTQTVYKRNKDGKIEDASWEITAGQTIENPEIMYQGEEIKDKGRLLKEHPETKVNDWTKEKGNAIITPKKGAKKKNGKPIKKARRAEIHYYKTKQTGPVDLKRTSWKD